MGVALLFLGVALLIWGSVCIHFSHNATLIMLMYSLLYSLQSSLTLLDLMVQLKLRVLDLDQSGLHCLMEYSDVMLTLVGECPVFAG